MNCSTKPSIDVVIPIFNEQKNIVPLVKYISSVLSLTFLNIKFILVDDGSTDDGEKEITKLKDKDPKIFIQYIRLTKNYGQDLAIKCGVDHSTSEICAVIDADFQHPPEKILEAYDKIREGYNIVHIIKKQHTIGPKYRKVGSVLFNKLANIFIGNIIHLTNFKVLDCKAIKIIKNFQEANYFNIGIIDGIGLKSALLKYEPQKRGYGRSKYSFIKLLSLATDGIISVSAKPLRAISFFGFIIAILSFIYGAYIVFEKIIFGQPIPGFLTITAGLFFLGGVQLLFLGILGEYVGKIFMESKKRPQYVIDHIIEI